MSYDEVLTERELCAISGIGQKELLKRWLSQNSIPFLLAHSGWPRVHCKALERAMGVSTHSSQPKKVEFNFDAIK
jgi:hypothetical protein